MNIIIIIDWWQSVTFLCFHWQNEFLFLYAFTLWLEYIFVSKERKFIRIWSISRCVIEQMSIKKSMRNSYMIGELMTFSIYLYMISFLQYHCNGISKKFLIWLTFKYRFGITIKKKYKKDQHPWEQSLNSMGKNLSIIENIYNE